ncbi:hypothetical protein SprV_0802624500 [Sparganum proliferum]
MSRVHGHPVVMWTTHACFFISFNSFNPMPDEEETSLLLPDGRKLDELRVADLKKELENRGLNKSGVKKELVQRLAESLSNSGDVLASEKNVDGESKSQQLHCATPDKVDVPNSESLLENETPVSEPTEVEINGVHEVEAANVTGDLSPSHAIQELPPSSTEPSLPKPVEPTEDLLPSSALISRPSVTRVDSATAELEAEEEDYEDENMDVIPPPEPVPAPEPSARSSQTTLRPHDASNQRSTDALAKSPAPSPAPSVKPPPPAASATSSKPPKETRGIGYLAEGPERIEPSAENRHPPTELVYIRFLMRPFTPGQLSKMIESQFGKVCELWLDKIKSSAVVRMENQEAAKSCREGIDGCRWPSINPRILRCDFASEALLAWLKEHGDSGDRNPPRHLLIGAPPPAEKVDSHAPADKSHSSQRKRTSSTSGEKSSSRTLAGAHTERRRKHTEGTSPAKVDGTTAPKSEEPSKALDDLFKKTTAAPSIYWLPLSDEEAAAQTKRRLERYIAENTRRTVSSRRNQGGDTREARSPFAESETQQRPARQPSESNTTRGVPPTEDRKATARQDRSPFPAKRQRSSPSLPAAAPKRRSRSPAQRTGREEEPRPVKRRRDSPTAAAADERGRRRRGSSSSLDRRRLPRR